MKIEDINKILKYYKNPSASQEVLDTLRDIERELNYFNTLEESKVSSIFHITEEHGFIPDIDNNKLAEEILSSHERFTEDYTDTRFEDTKIIINNNSEAHKVLVYMRNIAESKSLSLSDWWSQIHQPLESTDIHVHLSLTVNIKLSWVYYVKVPEGAGSLVFHLDDRYVTHEIKPIVGKYIIFPSWLKHKVTKNLSKDVRICMAGNFC